jgi:hypothetical protein
MIDKIGNSSRADGTSPSTDQYSVSKSDKLCLKLTLTDLRVSGSMDALVHTYAKTSGAPSEQSASFCRDLEALRLQIPPQLKLNPIPWPLRIVNKVITDNVRRTASRSCDHGLASVDSSSRTACTLAI